MNYDPIKKAAKLNKRRRRKKMWRRVVGTLALLVVLGTAYSLILPAVTQDRQAHCGHEAHTHSESCMTMQPVEKVLTCELTEEVHTHDENCYRPGEAHYHSEECYSITESIVCGMEESEGHLHTEECLMQSENLLCTTEENHFHAEGCFAEEIICGLEEGEEHIHEAACISSTLICTLPEGHLHTAECYEKLLVCELPEREAHIHSEECIQQEKVLICELEEGIPGEPVLICEAEETQPHIHSEECYSIPEGSPLSCYQLTEEDHVHDESCYSKWSLSCELEEHEHQLICYSDPTADVEWKEVWEQSLEGTELMGVWHKDILKIAETQLGYRESSLNYIVLEDGETTKGYSRYGQWYGDNYGDWCAMFVAFCLEYAEVEGVPYDASCSRFIELLQEAELYAEADTYTPREGDLIFFDYEGDNSPDHIGIVEKTEDGKVFTIEGNSGDAVARNEYELTDESIFAYGKLPDRQIPSKTHYATVYTDSSYSVPLDDGTEISITGGIPESALVLAYPTELESEKEVLCAYDITIFLPDGSEYEIPEGHQVTVSISTAAAPKDSVRGFEAYYVPDEGEWEELEVEAEDGVASFTTDHFSVYAIALGDDAEAFHYEDSEKKISLKIFNSSYSPDRYQLVVEEMHSADYSSALQVFQRRGQEIKETAIYKIYLKDKNTNQTYTNLNGSYEIAFEWPNGLFQTVTEDDVLDFVYNRNPRNEPTALNNETRYYNDEGMVVATEASDYSYPASCEFMFIRSEVGDELKAGQYSLRFNKVKDAFIRDSAYADYFNENSPIGTAGSFHIVAFEEANLNAHTNGNVLARDLYANSNFGTNNYAKELSYAQRYFQINSVSASSDKHVLVLGSENTIGYADNGNAFSINGVKLDRPKELVQDKNTAEAPFIDLSRVKAEIAQIAGSLDSRADANLVYKSATDNGQEYSTLDLSSSDAVGVINIKAEDIASKFGHYLRIGGFTEDGGGSVVINVDCSNVTQIDMPRARVLINGDEQDVNEVVDFSAGKVIWNFTNAEDVVINTHLMTGMVVAPGATVNINQNLNGTVVADIVNVKAESHRTDFTGRITDKSYSVVVKKIRTGYAGTTLPGAEFDLCKWNGSSWTKVNSAPLVTDSHGEFALDTLDTSTAYKLTETKAPPGYEIKDPDYFFWVKENSGQNQPNIKPSEFSGQAISKYSAILISNDKKEDYIDEFADLEVNKEWKDFDGTPLADITVDSITVNIYQITDGDPATKVLYQVLKLDSAGGWSAKIEKMPTIVHDELGNQTVYTYTAEEVKVEGYTVSITQADGKVSIVNTKEQGGYILPETGGPGKEAVTGAGSLITAAALMMLIKISIKRRVRKNGA